MDFLVEICILFLDKKMIGILFFKYGCVAQVERMVLLNLY